MSDAAPAALVMPSGSWASGELAYELQAEAEAWAGQVAPGAVYVADEPVAQATARVFTERSGPLLVVWPVLARFRPEHAAGALGDLRSGCDLVLGPVIDGGLYLLGLTRPLAELVPAPDQTWAGGDAMTTAFAAALEAGFEVGILRAERALRGPTDVRAALADPLTPERIVSILAAA